MKANTGQGFYVSNPGALTLIQDLGRCGYQHLGLSPGGAADEHAFLWANRLLGNSSNCPALEINLGGLDLEVDANTRMALTGADLQATLNDQVIAPWQTMNLRPGDRLKFSYPKHGLRAYLAVQGGFKVKPVLGSAATVTREQIGGLDGKGTPLKNGDFLPCFPFQRNETPRLATRVPVQFIPDYAQPLTLRTIKGHQYQQFAQDDTERFFSTSYHTTNQSNRMGTRLRGEPLQSPPAGIVSEGISFGAVQVPPDGQPIILLKDRQTIGGYPKLGTVFALDAFALSQRPPETPVRFEPMSLDEAQKRLRRFYQFFL